MRPDWVTEEERRKGRALAAEVAELIEREVLRGAGRYDQRMYITDCGSPSCIGGWTVWLVHGKPKNLRDIYQHWDPSAEARDLLGLSYFEAHELFRARPLWKQKGTEADAADAVAVLRRYAEEDVVEWRH